MLLNKIAICSSGFFAGAAIYITLVQHPSIISKKIKENSLIEQFRIFYPKAAALQGTLAIVGSFSAIIDSIRNLPNPTFKNILLNDSFLSGLFLFIMWPYTYFCMFPLNHSILDSSTEQENHNGVIYSKLEHWGRLHFVRTILSSISFFFILFKPISYLKK
eukprot:TRINITY_DN8627_c0_g1_i1.p1 TRINITY_DN8627_c0_g1~~TRINITY_DN8627_c0_g1_i1.p1  ORF type:complete len:161 (-),score=58.92 TRINITY_DN8627_c0_g1_i1:42-524(-)